MKTFKTFFESKEDYDYRMNEYMEEMEARVREPMVAAREDY